MATLADTNDLLKPYVPRLVIEWLRGSPSDIYRSVDGSLVFVDISGFTTMTERLARKGKIGAEEIADVLNTCFADLLAVAYSDGAGLIKWGGDAVLLLFDGPHHAERACRAAVGMRRTLREIGTIHTSAGNVRLRMSVGIHSGVFEFFLVGDLHHELVITGPAATHTVSMESTAEAGEILVSRATAEMLPSRALGEAKGEGVLIRRAPHVRYERAEAVVDVRGLDLASCVPLGIREHLLSGLGEPEHRRVAVSFIEIGGTDDLLREAGPDFLGSALDEAVRTVQAACARHGVTFLETDISANGLKILLVAGAPTTSGANEDGMLAATRRILDANTRLHVRIGVNRGRVFAGDFGPPFRKTYSIKGDAVNLAARVMGKAPVDGALVTDAVVDRAKAMYRLAPLEPFRVKGKARPVQAFELGPLEREVSVTFDRETPLVGRDAEMSTLLEAMGSARSRRGRVVELVAEPGMGKSRLVQELLGLAGDRFVVLTAQCELYESSTPYFPVRALLREAIGIRSEPDPAVVAARLRNRVEANAPHLLPWLPLLSVPIDIDVPMTRETDQLQDTFRAERLAEVVDGFLEWTLPTPTLFVVEDAHWMDEASSAVMTRLMERAGSRPWLMCLTRREQDTGLHAPQGSGITTIQLAPLYADDVVSLLEIATDEAPLPAHDMAALVERSGGNPLFLRELVDATRAAGSVDALPETVEGILSAQIDRLTPRDRDVLRSAAVLGLSFRPELLTGLLDGIDLERDEWERLGSFVEPGEDGGLRFRHALVRDAAYEGLPYRRRRALHGRVGESLERQAGDHAEEQAELLSLHYLEGQRHAEAWRYARVAAERAEAKYALADARGFYRRALRAARSLGDVEARELARVHEALGDASDRIGLYEEAASAYRAARRLRSDDPIEEAKLRLKEAWIHERVGAYTASFRAARRGLRLLESLERDEALAQRTRLSAWCGSIRLSQGKYREAIAWCRRAVAAAEAVGELQPVAHASFIEDWAHVELGELDLATHSDQALEIYERTGDLAGQAAVLNNLGMFRYFEGRWNEALELYERGREAYEQIGDTVDAAMGTTNIGEILSDQGRLDEARSLFRKALRTWSAAGRTEAIALTDSNLGRVAARSGDHEEALKLYARARAMFERMGDDGEVLETDARIAECFVFRGHSQGALERADQGLRDAKALGGIPPQLPLLHRVRGYALLQLGRFEDAGAAFTASMDAARARQAEFEVSLTGRALVDLARLTGELPEEDLVVLFTEALQHLGVVALPEVPLPTAAGGWAAASDG